MKKLLAILVWCLPAMSAFAADSLSVDTEIKSVVVYRRGASVSRTGSLDLPAGASTVYLSHLSPALDPATIRVSVDDDDVTMQSVKHEFVYETVNARQADFDRNTRRLLVIKDSLRLVDSQTDRLSQRLGVLSGNDEIKDRDGISAAELQELVQYYRSEWKTISKQLFQLDNTRNRLTQESRRLQQENEVIDRQAVKVVSRVKLEIDAVRSKRNLPVQLSYLVYDAWWTPSYEVRIKDVSEPLGLVYSAQVRQESDEDWNKVKLTLSTSDPSSDNTAPSFEKLEVPVTNHNHAQKQNARPQIQWVRGRVTLGADGLTEAGIEVLEAGTDNRTLTDAAGRFQLEMKDRNHHLSFAYEGYASVALASLDYMAVNLKESGSTPNSQVQNRTQSQTQGVDQALQGRVSGVTVKSKSGQPGHASDIRIRGVGRVSKADEPVYVVDGQILTDISHLNPNDIVSMEVLKDQSETAIFGSRAANGVVVVKTKKAANQKREVQELKVNASTLDTEFEIEAPYSIPSNGKDYKVDMLDYTIHSDYQYSVLPRRSKEVWLSARVPDYAQYSLLEGVASLYLENVYQGTATLRPQAWEDTLTVSIGRDKDIVVDRQEVKDYTVRKRVGNNIRVQKGFEITVKNNKQIPVKLMVVDQYPVSNNSEMTVKLVETGGAQVEEETGKLTWPLLLQPGERRTFRFAYEVKYPSRYGYGIVE